MNEGNRKMSDYLPREVLIEILTRLPVKSLLRFRSVCKFFHSTMSSPSFISNHINNAKHNRVPIVRYLSREEISVRQQHYLFLPNLQELDFPFKSEQFLHFEIVGFSNGLFCLSDSRYYNSGYGIILWNPSIRKYVSLPKPRVTFMSHHICNVVLGFGFDCITDDYKVVRIATIKGQEMVSRQVEIYSVKSGSWYNDCVPPPYLMIPCYKPAFVEGCLHWLGWKTAGDGDNLIVSFDLSNNEFLEINIPDDLQYVLPHSVLTVLANKLAGIRYDSRRQQAFTVWVMEEYGMFESWRKMYNVTIGNECLAFVGFTNDRRVLVKVTNGDLVLHDPNDTSITHVGVRGENYSFHMEMYMESLVLLNKESATMQPEAIDQWMELTKILDLLVHASQCRYTNCQYPDCRQMKALFRHSMLCKIRASGGCALCKKMWCLLKLHIRVCKESQCTVPRCNINLLQH